MRRAHPGDVPAAKGIDMSDHEITRDEVAALSRKLAEDGKLIAAGWVGCRLAIVPAGAGKAQVDDMEMAFMGGAQHLWASIMSILDPGKEPTKADLRKMTLIDNELRDFAAKLTARVHGVGH
jgi:hypothetical protein